jgi:hypothetical protein
LAIALFLARLPFFLNKLKMTYVVRRTQINMRWLNMGLAILMAACGVSLARNFYSRCHLYVLDNLMLRENPALASHRDLISILLRLGNMSGNDKKRTVLFIPRNTRQYWRWPTDLENQIPFLAPALTGLPLVAGLSCELKSLPTYYGYLRVDIARLMRENSENVGSDFCGRVEKDGFNRVVSIVQNGEELHVELANC